MNLAKVPSEKFGTIRGTYCNKIQPIETFFESESASDFKGFEALHSVVLDIDDQLLCSDVQTKARHIYMMTCNICLRCFSKMLTN